MRSGIPLEWLIAVFLLATLAACSANRYLTGLDIPNLAALQPGISKKEAEVILGKPERTWITDLGIEYDVYATYVGSKPRPGAAAALVLMDVGTVGVLETVPAVMEKKCEESYPEHGKLYYECVTPIYGMKMVNVLVSYDKNNVVLGLFNEFDQLPLDGRSTKRPSVLLMK